MRVCITPRCRCCTTRTRASKHNLPLKPCSASSGRSPSPPCMYISASHLLQWRARVDEETSSARPVRLSSIWILPIKSQSPHHRERDVDAATDARPLVWGSRCDPCGPRAPALQLVGRRRRSSCFGCLPFYRASSRKLALCVGTAELRRPVAPAEGPRESSQSASRTVRASVGAGGVASELSPILAARPNTHSSVLALRSRNFSFRSAL